MAANLRKRLALDTNVLMDLSRGSDWAHDFLDAFRRLAYELLVPPTVVAELTWLALGDEPEDAANASRALGQLDRPWRLLPFELPSVHEAVAARFAGRLIEQGLLPEDETCDGIILAEASLQSVPLLATSDNHLLGIEEFALKLAFADADLEPVAVASPRRLLKALR
ncbi:MAG: type II toxin-antitoxin system VapC family toxin [Verrucomicrobia bacterium]|nr:type II toxin-antitoxin system VapC family toxin [Verrucomicrobiota bacterium]